MIGPDRVAKLDWVCGSRGIPETRHYSIRVHQVIPRRTISCARATFRSAVSGAVASLLSFPSSHISPLHTLLSKSAMPCSPYQLILIFIDTERL